MPHLWLWIATMLGISISPGAGAVASMSSGRAHGWRKGIWTAVGQQLALLLFLLISALGLASLLRSSPKTVQLLTVCGAVYLAWIGLRMWHAALRPRKTGTAQAYGVVPAHRLGMIRYGFLANASNPKALLALFVITPNFIAPEHPLLPQYTIIGVTMVAIDLAVMAVYTAIGSHLLRSLQEGPWGRRVDAFFGSLFLIAAALVAFT